MSTKTAKRKLPPKIAQPVVRQKVKSIDHHALNDARTVVSGGGNATGKKQEVISISSESSSSEAEDEEALDEDDIVEETTEDVPMAELVGEDAAAEEDGGDTGEPSFGDLVLANNSETIDVAGAFDEVDSRALTYPTKIQAPSGASLGTVLTQALKTNDTTLLESCLHTTDTPTIRATIQRLDSTLAGSLLQKLAERLHKRPGRAGSLTVWVQWTLVTHGGFLATQPDLIKKLAGLHRVMEERARGLNSLLSLKGKLDMLEAQTELRKGLQTQRRRAEEDEIDDDVIYVEGQDSEEDAAVAKPKRLARNGDLEDISDDESEVPEDFPLANGVIGDSEEEEEESSDEGFLDDEAEETDADTGDEDEVDHDDQDSQDDDDESEDGAPPPSKLQRVGSAFSKRR